MSVRIEVRRHSFKDGAGGKELGPKGRAYAEFIGANQLRGRGFTHFFVSPLVRTMQTLEAMAVGAGDFHPSYRSAKIPDVYLDWPELKDMFRVCHRAELECRDMVAAAWSHADGDVASEAQEEYVEMFEVFAESLPDGANALLIGHSPQLELVAHGLTREEMPGLKECDGYGLLLQNGILWVDREGDKQAFKTPTATLREEFLKKYRGQRIPRP